MGNDPFSEFLGNLVSIFMVVGSALITLFVAYVVLKILAAVMSGFGTSLDPDVLKAMFDAAFRFILDNPLLDAFAAVCAGIIAYLNDWI